MSASLFQQFLQPPRSAMEYAGDFARADAEREQLAAARQTNALNAMTLQEKRTAQADALENRNALARVAATWGAETKPAERIASLRSTGRPALIAQADALEKSDLEAQEKRSKIGEQDGKTLDAALARYRGVLDFIDTREGAARWLQAQYSDPVLGPQMQRLGSIEQALQGIPTDPQQFQQWRQQAAIGMAKFMEQQTQRRGQDVTVRGQDMTDRRTREEGEASRRVQIRGQDLTNDRARDSNSTQRELLIQEKGLKVAELQDQANSRARAKEAGISAIGNQIGVIDKALAHPGRETSTGLSGTLDPRNYVPGTDATDFRAVLDQIGGTAFLQAFESLKGGGAITEMEGKKATDAIARLNRAQSDGEFEVALNDLRQVMTDGYKRMSGKAYEGRGAPKAKAPSKPTAEAFADAEKERRYQEWKRKREAQAQ